MKAGTELMLADLGLDGPVEALLDPQYYAWPASEDEATAPRMALYLLRRAVVANRAALSERDGEVAVLADGLFVALSALYEHCPTAADELAREIWNNADSGRADRTITWSARAAGVPLEVAA